MQCFEAIHIITAAVESRFSLQTGIDQLLMIEWSLSWLLLSAADESNEALLKTVLEIFGKNFEKGRTQGRSQVTVGFAVTAYSGHKSRSGRKY